MSDIINLRDKIDKITLEILKMIKERNEVAKEIGNVKIISRWELQMKKEKTSFV